MAFFSLLNELIKKAYIAYFDRDVHCLAENGPWFHVLFHCFIATLHIFLEVQDFCWSQTILFILYSPFSIGM